MQWNHWVARANYPHQPFKDFDSAKTAWDLLKKTFPEKLAAVLMPNHLHLILPVGIKGNKINFFLMGITQRQKLNVLWQPTPPPSLIPNQQHLQRNIRYIALNPCREKLCKDPLEWLWSTYRDCVGGSVDAPPPLPDILAVSKVSFWNKFHSYVSSDPSVNVSGSHFPQAVPKRELPYESIGEILCAAGAALRMRTSEITHKNSPVRFLFIHLAHRQGWYQPNLLAKMCMVDERSVRRALERPIPINHLNAGTVCLGDARLRWGVPN